VLVADAGIHRSKQLAGELLHPSGLQDLEALGLGGSLWPSGAQVIRGFAAIDAAGPRDSVCLLPYPGGEKGLALEHAALVEPLLTQLEGRPGITVWRQARLTSIIRNEGSSIEATISRSDGEQRVRAKLIVGADGRASAVRRLLNIDEDREKLSSMLGLLVSANQLPHPGFGHLFIGGLAPVLAYAISADRARVMIDVPTGTKPEELVASAEILAGLPENLREAVKSSLGSGILHAANETRLPKQVALHRAVLVGDAAGCCHPLSASGLASGTCDARVLQKAIQESAHDIPRAVQLYVQRRRAAQRTRIALASALYRTFTERSPEMAALRAGLFRYWGRSRNGRAVSMALLSTRESRMRIMAQEYARAVGHAVVGLFGPSPHPSQRQRPWGTALGLMRTTLPHFRETIRGAVADLRSSRPRGVD
jgi:2-polyprenyl-6-methoxyphenol hydroxylase-like FAD-dependent oxidoreductase